MQVKHSESLDKVVEMERRVKELETAMQDIKTDKEKWEKQAQEVMTKNNFKCKILTQSCTMISPYIRCK